MDLSGNRLVLFPPLPSETVHIGYTLSFFRLVLNAISLEKVPDVKLLILVTFSSLDFLVTKIYKKTIKKNTDKIRKKTNTQFNKEGDTNHPGKPGSSQ